MGKSKARIGYSAKVEPNRDEDGILRDAATYIKSLSAHKGRWYRNKDELKKLQQQLTFVLFVKSSAKC